LKLDVFEGKKYGNYNIVVNIENIKSIKEKVHFYLKIFSNEEILLEELEETIDYKFTG